MDYDQKEAVFYNKVQVFNRDISIQVIKMFAEKREKEKHEKYLKKLDRFNVLKEDAIKAGNPATIEQRPVRSKQEDAFLAEGEDTEMEDIEVYQNPRGPDQRKIVPPLRPPKGIAILDALAATGLRSVRYLKEIPDVRKLVINDIVPEATEQAKINCRNNEADMSKVVINNGDAVEYMYAHRDPHKRFDVVDLDPYGTAAPFLDSAVQAVADGGLICCTCTDMAVLSGNFPEKCFSLYGTVGLKANYMHEASLRTLLHALDSAANKHKKYIVPWLSLSVDFYIRVFVRVYESPAEVKKSLTRRMMVYQSTQCESFYAQPMGSGHATKKNPETKQHLMYTGSHVTAPSVCPETGSALRLGGPYWGAAIHDQDAVDQLLARADAMAKSLRKEKGGSEEEEDEEEDEDAALAVAQGGGDGDNDAPPVALSDDPSVPATLPRIRALLGVISKELKDVPLYYIIPSVASTLHMQPPTSDKIRSAIHNAGYRFSRFHHEPGALKTDAPPHVLWDIMREWAKRSPPPGSKHKKTRESALKILSNPITTDVDFSLVQGARKARYVATEDGGKIRNVMFPINPDENWGPKRKHGTLAAKEEAEAGGGGQGKKAKGSGDDTDA
jgi:tRNA (guanine26-N2/guanine27-N2)-dimethyltransferase